MWIVYLTWRYSSKAPEDKKGKNVRVFLGSAESYSEANEYLETYSDDYGVLYEEPDYIDQENFRLDMFWDPSNVGPKIDLNSSPLKYLGYYKRYESWTSS